MELYAYENHNFLKYLIACKICQNHWKMTIFIFNLNREKNLIIKCLIAHMKNKTILVSVLTKKYGIYNFLMEIYAYENHNFFKCLIARKIGKSTILKNPFLVG